jgi:hypothetical protein
MKYEPTVTYEYDDSIPKEEAEWKVAQAYDILFKETIKMMEKSSKPEHIAFLKKFPYLQETNKIR